MREIKFRVWDEKENKFWYFTLQEILERRMCYRGSWDEKIMRGEKTQYTGFRDVEGNEIYEGDILHREGYWNIKIEFEKGVFWVRDLDEVRYNNKVLNTPIALFEIKTFKVIGNIYNSSKI